ncbi:hypothetical protein TanjilG_02806 [Lupinus angustifolius]|uniref:Phosphate-induced protein n=1 Tax=Lupinus angustifolius TaxID=3871 RepID=A0A1J7IQK8_LUPAN|nr:hypothetical protein TanjilG_02806 [Lupinus angustifolius]
MAPLAYSSILLTLFLTLSLFHSSLAARKLSESDQELQLFKYHKGPLLSGKISINLIWYGKFKPSQRAIISDFITSLSSSPSKPTSQPSVAKWWKTTEKYYHLTTTRNNKSPNLALSLGTQILDENYSLGKSLNDNQILKLASKGAQKNAINVVLTAADVTVDGFCSSKCGSHGSSAGARINGKSLAARKLSESDQELQLFKYHKGPLLSGKISINLIWYGKFKPSQRAIISDFITSLSSSPSKPTSQPSVAKWWKTTEKYYHLTTTRNNKSPNLALSLGTQILDENYSLGKSLNDNQILKLASKGAQKNAINVVLTAADVTVDGFCSSKCGSHGSSAGARINGKRYKFAYIWVGNSETQCPGQCAWPFHQPIYGPQNPALVAPNNDVGLDGMVINVASLLAGTATNPFGNGYFQGPKEAPLEAASACTGVYGKGAYPGYAGNLLVDPTTGASYNANGINGRKYLVPALFDPKTSSCATLV